MRWVSISSINCIVFWICHYAGGLCGYVYNEHAGLYMLYLYILIEMMKNDHSAAFSS